MTVNKKSERGEGASPLVVYEKVFSGKEPY